MKSALGEIYLIFEVPLKNEIFPISNPAFNKIEIFHFYFKIVNVNVSTK
jgi:hypothetical protein